MITPIPDPGFGDKVEKRAKRIITADGSYNIIKKGRSFSTTDVYKRLLSMSWRRLILIVLMTYIAINLMFALIYMGLGIENLKDREADLSDFWNAFFFSIQTITTVGYGDTKPIGMAVNLVVAVESMFGWIGFAVATSLLFQRFTHPQVRMVFSHKALIAPHKGKNSLQVQVVNVRKNIILNANAKMLLVLDDELKQERKYYELPLERNEISYLPLNWKLVHLLDDNSPLAGFTSEAIDAQNAEILVQVEAFDDTFSQKVHARRSYIADEIVWGANFVKPYFINDDGYTEIHLKQIHEYEPAELLG